MPASSDIALRPSAMPLLTSVITARAVNKFLLIVLDTQICKVSMTVGVLRLRIENWSERWKPSRWCLKQPEQSRAQPACLDGADAGRRRRRRRLERRQHRHRAAVVVRPDAAISGHGLSAGSRLRIGRPRGRGRIRQRASCRASGCSFPAPNASAKCAGCSAPRHRAWWCRRSAWCRSTSSLGDRGISAGAGGDRLSRDRRARRLRAGLHRRPRRARAACWRASSIAVAQRSAGGVGEKSGARRRRRRLWCDRSRARHAPRLQEHLRRQRRCRACSIR